MQHADFDPKNAHRGQFLHPIVRYFAPDVPAAAERSAYYHGETASHHVLEDTYTDFTNGMLSLILKGEVHRKLI